MKNDLRSRLDRMFSPASVAVFGAGLTPDKVGHAIMDSILSGGYSGRIYPIHPKHDRIMGLKVYRGLDDLPELPDLAVVALNQYSTAKLVSKLSAVGVSGASLIAGGFLEMGDEGASLQDQLKSAAGDMPIVGPNTLGFLNAHARLNVTFYPRVMRKGPVSLISQSGGIGLGFVGRAEDEGVGLAKWVGVGNRVNLEFHTLVDYLRDDADTHVICIFAEGCAEPRLLIEQISKTVHAKPVIFYKGGTGDDADRVTVTHTGAAAGEARIWDGALKQAGVHIVTSISEMVTVSKALAYGKTPEGNRIGIFTHTAGPSITAWDVLKDEPGCILSNLNENTIKRIAEILGPSVPVVYKNPVDGAGGAFLTEPFHDIAEAMLNDSNVDALLAIFCEHKSWEYPSDALAELSSRFKQPIVACFIGSISKVADARDQLHNANVPTYVLPEEAAVGLRALLRQAKLEKS